eukprot:COSAG01_NODE_103_length_26263_cov_31.957728_7_plen_353_part_00
MQLLRFWLRIPVPPIPAKSRRPFRQAALSLSQHSKPGSSAQEQPAGRALQQPHASSRAQGRPQPAPSSQPGPSQQPASKPEMAQALADGGPPPLKKPVTPRMGGWTTTHAAADGGNNKHAFTQETLVIIIAAAAAAGLLLILGLLLCGRRRRQRGALSSATSPPCSAAPIKRGSSEPLLGSSSSDDDNDDNDNAAIVPRVGDRYCEVVSPTTGQPDRCILLHTEGQSSEVQLLGKDCDVSEEDPAGNKLTVASGAVRAMLYPAGGTRRFDGGPPVARGTLMGTDAASGLTTIAAHARGQRFGPNLLEEARRKPCLELLKHFWGPVRGMRTCLSACMLLPCPHQSTSADTGAA